MVPGQGTVRFQGAVSDELQAVGIEQVPDTVDMPTRKLAEDYQTTTERINPLIERAEKGLSALRLGVSASVPLEDNDEEGWFSFLVFQKEDKDWRLFVETGEAGLAPDLWERKPLKATSRATRLRALPLLPALEAKLVETATQQMRGAIETVHAAEAYLANLESRAK